MPINMQFAPDLVLRDISEYKTGKKQKDECVPLKLQEGSSYSFLKTGQRAYWLDGEQPLLLKREDGSLSAPIASLIITEVTHFKIDGNIWTKGIYYVKKVIQQGEVYFNGCEPILKA